MTKKNKGWTKHSREHALAAHGVKSKDMLNYGKEFKSNIKGIEKGLKAMGQDDMKQTLENEYYDGVKWVRVLTSSGREVWIDLTYVNPLDVSPSIDEVRGMSFWGSPSRLDSEFGWYFDFDDIEEITKRIRSD